MASLFSYRRRISLLWMLTLLFESSCFISLTSAGLMIRRNPRGTTNDDDAVTPTPTPDEQQQQEQEKLATSENENEEAYYDERTLLDTFGDFCKEYFTQKVIPTTDIECKWDWRFVRCEPYCECDYLPQRGDYHLGRSCRISTEKLDKLGECNPDEQIPTDNTIQLMIQKIVRNSQKAIDVISNKVKKHYNIIQDRVCTELPDKALCDVITNANDDTVILAWQERLLCRHLIPDCSKYASTITSSSSTTSTPHEGQDEEVG